jgi:two-component system sensor histidine kinase HydH
MIHPGPASGDSAVESAPPNEGARVVALVVASGGCSLLGLILVVWLTEPLRQAAIVVLFALSAAFAFVAARGIVRRDVSREREIEKRANERHLASLGAMTAVISHEIRNPLAALKGNAQLLAETTRDDPKFRTRVDRVVKEAVALEQLTTDLLTFVRSGRLRRDATDVRVLVEQGIGAVGADDVVLVAPDEAVLAPIDRVRFMQAIDNLLRNAKQHGKAPIDVAIRTENAFVVIEVRDHGKGIPEAELERIFEPFVTDATRGTGLGLAVVRRVAELHGGDARADNAREGGARFTLRFPLSMTKAS